MKKDITCVFEGFAGLGAIYISDLKAAQNAQLLNQLEIKAVVTLLRGDRIRYSKHDVPDHLIVPVNDLESEDLSQHFQSTYEFIDAVRKKTNVLVHCYAGRSRSATIVIAYLLKKYHYSLDNVVAMVKRKRNKIYPNRGFLEQLETEAGKLGLASSSKNLQSILCPRKALSLQRSSFRKTHLNDERRSQQTSHRKKINQNGFSDTEEPIRQKSIQMNRNEQQMLNKLTLKQPEQCCTASVKQASILSLKLSSTTDVLGDTKNLQQLELRIERFKAKLFSNETKKERRSYDLQSGVYPAASMHDYNNASCIIGARKRARISRANTIDMGAFIPQNHQQKNV